MKKTLRNKKGFTLAELLIVVAIIAVLVAIAIPIFTAQIEKAAEATDLANMRSSYAEAQVKVLEGDAAAATYEGGSFKAQSTGEFNKASTDGVSNWYSGITGLSVTKGNKYAVTITVDANGKETITVAEKQ